MKGQPPSARGRAAASAGVVAMSLWTSKGPWDYYKLLQTTGAEDAFRAVAGGGCSLVRS